MKKITSIWAVVIILGASQIGFAKELKSVSIRVQWAPQAQFAGYYVALEKGFYRQAGLDVVIRSGGPRISPIYNVISGKDTFGTDWLSSGITVVAQGAPIVNIAQMIQTSGLMLVSLKTSGIDDPIKMDGKRVGVWTAFFSIPPSLLFKKLGIRPRLVSQGFSIRPFLEGKIDVASAMIYNEYHMILEAGVSPQALNVFHFNDFGLNFPEDSIYTHIDTLKNSPDMCQAFVKASVKGWQYAFEHPDTAVSIVMRIAEQAKTGTRATLQTRMLEEIQKLMLYRVGNKQIGQLSLQDFNFVRQALIETGRVKQPVLYEKFYKPFID